MANFSFFVWIVWKPLKCFLLSYPTQHQFKAAQKRVEFFSFATSDLSKMPALVQSVDRTLPVLFPVFARICNA